MQSMNREQKSQALFFTLINQYQMQALISLGQLKNPATDKIEQNLELAKMSIDMLDMLKDKTKGNLSEDEIKMLDQTLSQLQMNYIAEFEKSKKQKPVEDATTKDTKPDEKESGKTDKKE